MMRAFTEAERTAIWEELCRIGFNLPEPGERRVRRDLRKVGLQLLRKHGRYIVVDPHTTGAHLVNVALDDVRGWIAARRAP
ncbi:MAG TPA: hypothetical protein VH913_19340 [Hyphomicrobiaceae bacterium]|jgi:hypothetical protein